MCLRTVGFTALHHVVLGVALCYNGLQHKEKGLGMSMPRPLTLWITVNCEKF